MRMLRASLFASIGLMIVGSIGCESPNCCRAPRPQYLPPPGAYLPPPPAAYSTPAPPPGVIPENMPSQPPNTLPPSLNSVPTIPAPNSGSGGPTLPPPTKLGTNGKALSARNEPPVRLGEPVFLSPPIAVDNEIPKAEIIEIYGIGPNGEKIPGKRYDENGREIKPGTVPGVVPLPPGTDLPPLPPAGNTPKLRPVPFRPDLTA